MTYVVAQILKWNNNCCDFFPQVFVLLTASTVFPTKASLYLNDRELSTHKLTLLAGTSSLLNCHKRPDVSE